MSAVDKLNEITTKTSIGDTSILSLISSADLIGKLVMLMLIAASFWCWTITIKKIITLKQLKSKIAHFESIFWAGQILDQLYESIRRNVDNPLAAVFIAAMNECKRNQTKTTTSDSYLKIGQKERILQAMYLARNNQLEALEKNISFLAIVGTNATFVGLFGTVWGIMHSFQSIASSQNTTLAVVAPGIAEALLATAIGLVAAIPAVIFYNYLTARINSIGNKIEDFIGELSSILSRAIDEEKM